jgi:hypothetical protein
VWVSVDVLLENGTSVYHVAVAMVTAVQDLDIPTRYLTETERTLPPPLPTLNGSITWHTFHSLLYFSLF